ncbi:PREDICTED: uncharacterized protein LOC105969777 [Erythranthe guttata]|uniref:uncharacterized protein LOC105969777 n=1 Tax=Erythranthe guttata TaxID=4155 RepID=UPI00064D97A4|nr:PREDICTED: uncharacterized protein LOC105969777 [Erythranthe guttata]|eukprot:XP_012850009.1 PREDICTED: uncharacterized protein LOC105969777 [Erythranthe guttata]
MLLVTRQRGGIPRCYSNDHSCACENSGAWCGSWQGNREATRCKPSSSGSLGQATYQCTETRCSYHSRSFFFFGALGWVARRARGLLCWSHLSSGSRVLAELFRGCDAGAHLPLHCLGPVDGVRGQPCLCAEGR